MVDLPAYFWNHEKTYWHETTASKEQRLTSKPRKDFFGIAVENQNFFEPQWRNWLWVSENFWVEDHKITGTTLYPGAGMLIMVIEAARDMDHGESSVKGIEFYDVHFERGLVIFSEGFAEVLLRIQNLQGAASAVHTFAIFLRTGQSAWTKHCYGNFLFVSQGNGFAELEAFEWAQHRLTYETIRTTFLKQVDV